MGLPAAAMGKLVGRLSAAAAASSQSGESAAATSAATGAASAPEARVGGGTGHGKEEVAIVFCGYCRWAAGQLQGELCAARWVSPCGSNSPHHSP